MTSATNGVPSAEPSAVNARLLGQRLSLAEQNLGRLQDRIDSIRTAIKHRQEAGRGNKYNDSATYRQEDLTRAQQNYDDALNNYYALRDTISPNDYTNALRAAPKNLFESGAPQPTNGSTIKYSSPNSFTGGGVVTTTGTGAGNVTGQLSVGQPVGVRLAPGVYTGPKGEQVSVQQGKGTGKGLLAATKAQYGNTPSIFLPRISTPLNITTTFSGVNDVYPGVNYFNTGSIGSDIGFNNNNLLSKNSNKSLPIIPFGQGIIENARERIGKGNEAISDFFNNKIPLDTTLSTGQTIRRGARLLGEDIQYFENPSLLFNDKKGFLNTNKQLFSLTTNTLGRIGIGALEYNPFGPQAANLALGGAQALFGEGLVRAENLFRGQSNINAQRTKLFYGSLPSVGAQFVLGTAKSLNTPEGVGGFASAFQSSRLLPGETFVVPQEFQGVKLDIVGRFLTPTDQATNFLARGGNVESLGTGGSATYQLSILAKEGSPYPLRGNKALYAAQRSAEPEFLNVQLNSVSTLAERYDTGYGKILDFSKPTNTGGSIGTVVTLHNLFTQRGEREFNLLLPRTVQNRIDSRSLAIFNINQASFTPLKNKDYLSPLSEQELRPRAGINIITSIPKSRTQAQYGFPFTDIPLASAPTNLPSFSELKQLNGVPLQEVSPAKFLKMQDPLAAQESAVAGFYARNEQVGKKGISTSLFFEKFTPRVLPDDTKSYQSLSPPEFTLGSEGGGILQSPRILSETKSYDVKTLFGRPQEIFPVQPKFREVSKPVQFSILNPKELAPTFGGESMKVRGLLRITEPVKFRNTISSGVSNDLFVLRSVGTNIKFDLPKGGINSFVFSKEGSGTIVTGIFRPRDVPKTVLDASGKLPKKVLDTTKYGGGSSAESLTKGYGTISYRKYVDLPNVKNMFLTGELNSPEFIRVFYGKTRTRNVNGEKSTSVKNRSFLYPVSRSYQGALEKELLGQIKRRTISKEANNNIKPLTSVGAFDNRPLQQLFTGQNTKQDFGPDLSGFDYKGVMPGEKIVLSTAKVTRPRTGYYPIFSGVTKINNKEIINQNQNFSFGNKSVSKQNNILSTKIVPISLQQNKQNTIQSSFLNTKVLQNNVQNNIQSSIQTNVQTSILSQNQIQRQEVISPLNTKNLSFLPSFNQTERKNKGKKKKRQSNRVLPFKYTPTLAGFAFSQPTRQKNLSPFTTGLGVRPIPFSRDERRLAKIFGG